MWCISCSKYNIADGMRQMFDPFERVARAHHICPCCERPFSAEEEDEFVKKVSMFIIQNFKAGFSLDCSAHTIFSIAWSSTGVSVNSGGFSSLSFL